MNPHLDPYELTHSESDPYSCSRALWFHNAGVNRNFEKILSVSQNIFLQNSEKWGKFWREKKSRQAVVIIRIKN